jgi:hypothetical protein
MRRAFPMLVLLFALPAAAQPLPPPKPDEALLVWCKRVFTGRAVVPLKCEESLDAPEQYPIRRNRLIGFLALEK